MKCEISQSCLTLCNPHELYSLWNSSGQNTGVGSFSLLQGIFPTQGSNPNLPHCRWILYQLGYQGLVCKEKEWIREKGVREGAYEKKKIVSFVTIQMSEGSTIGEIRIQRGKSPNSVHHPRSLSQELAKTWTLWPPAQSLSITYLSLDHFRSLTWFKTCSRHRRRRRSYRMQNKCSTATPSPIQISREFSERQQQLFYPKTDRSHQPRPLPCQIPEFYLFLILWPSG